LLTELATLGESCLGSSGSINRLLFLLVALLFFLCFSSCLGGSFLLFLLLTVLRVILTSRCSSGLRLLLLFTLFLGFKLYITEKSSKFGILKSLLFLFRELLWLSFSLLYSHNKSMC
jgi:hypothetical protein